MIRRRSQFIGSWIVIVVLALMMLSIVIAPPKGESLGTAIGVAVFFCACIWIIWLIGRTRVVLDDQRIRVVNVFQRWDIPWSIVTGIESSGEVAIRLVDGRGIQPAISGGSLLETLRGNRLQQRIRDRIEQHRPAGVPRDQEFVLTPKLALAPVRLAIFLVVVVGLSVLGQR